MSLRKFTAILMISLANVFILAHAFVPHYHHDGIVCFESEKSDCKSCADNGNTKDCCKNEGKHHTHLEDCNLPESIERDGNSINDFFSSLDFDFQELICICSLHCYDFLSQDEIVVAMYERYTAYIDNYTSPYVGSRIELRAPPTRIIS